MADPTRHSWIDDGPLAVAACVTVVPDATVDEVLGRLGADTSRTITVDDAAGGLGVAVTEVPGGVVAVEPLGFQGSLPTVLTRVAADGQAVSVFWDVNALNAFTIARDGAVTTTVDLLPDEDDDVETLTELGLPAELHALWLAAGDGEVSRWALGLALAEAATGVTILRAALESPRSYYRLPSADPDDEPAPTTPAADPRHEAGLTAMRSFMRRVDDLRARPSVLVGSVDLESSVEVTASPASTFSRARFVHGWPASNGGSGASIFEVGNQNIHDTTSPDDQFGGSAYGGIFTRIVAIDRPRTITWAWNWLLPDRDGNTGYTRWDSTRVLAEDSTVTITVTKISTRGEDPRSLVELRHSGVPESWAADLKALWTWHLALMATGDSSHW